MHGMAVALKMSNPQGPQHSLTKKTEKKPYKFTEAMYESAEEKLNVLMMPPS